MGAMRLPWHRDVGGELGQPAQGGIPVIPLRWRLVALLLATAVCLAMFVVAVLVGVGRI